VRQFTNLPFRFKPGRHLHTLTDNAVQLMKVGYSKAEATAAVLNTAGCRERTPAERAAFTSPRRSSPADRVENASSQPRL
jgi:hypothetical protein